MIALLLGLALTAAGPPVITTTIDAQAPLDLARLKEILAKRGVVVVADGEDAAWHLRLRQSQEQGLATWTVAVQRRGAAISAVRVLADHGLPAEVLLRNLALLVAEHTRGSSLAEGDPTRSVAAPLRDVPATALRPATTIQPLAVATAARRRPPSAKRTARWSLRLDSETAVPIGLRARQSGDVVRSGCLVGARLAAGRWIVELGAGYLHAFVSRPGSAASLPTATLRSVSPGRAFVSRVSLGFQLGRRTRWVVNAGLAGELDVNAPVAIVDNGVGRAESRLLPNLLPWIEVRLSGWLLRPVLRLGWRQPLMSTKVTAHAYEDPTFVAEMGRRPIKGAVAISLGLEWGLP